MWGSYLVDHKKKIAFYLKRTTREKFEEILKKVQAYLTSSEDLDVEALYTLIWEKTVRNLTAKDLQLLVNAVEILLLLKEIDDPLPYLYYICIMNGS